MLIEFLKDFVIFTFLVVMFEWPLLCMALGSVGSGVYVEDK